MLENLASQMQQLVAAMKVNAFFAFKCTALLWLIHIVNCFSRYQLNRLGLYPRTIRGLPGIVFSPFLHGSFDHLFFNSIPFFALADLLLINGITVFSYVSGAIILLSGFLIWLFGQPGNHIGASGVIMGYFGYLLAKAYFNFTATTIVLAGICLYYFGGLLLSLFPGAQKNVSWGGHLCGFISGIATAYYLPRIW